MWIERILTWIGYPKTENIRNRDNLYSNGNSVTL